MKKISTIIVEDEIHSLERLKKLLTEFKQIEIIGEAGDGETAVKLIDELEPDLVFLDIQLPVFNGFTVLEKITCKPRIIFVTSYDNYAIKAFEENAVDYLLKPTSPERLKLSLKRIEESTFKMDQDFINLLKNKVYPEYINRFAVKTKDEIHIIPMEKVNYFRADNKYLFLVTNEGEYFYDSTLKNLENLLDPSEFIRVNKTFTVSISKIAKFSKWFLGDYNVVLSDKGNTTIKIGRKYLPNCREKFKF